MGFVVYYTAEEVIIMDDSGKFEMNRSDWENWMHNAKMFIAPVLVLYLTGVIGVMSVEGHVFSSMDFYPNSFVQGGIALYVLNTMLDLVRKWGAGH